MNCEEVSELLPAYVLGALEAEEVEAVEAHLRAGREHDAELVDLRATVFAMDRFVEDEDETAPRAQPAALRAVPPALSAPAVAPGAWAGVSGAWKAAAIAAIVLVLFGTGWAAGQLITSSAETYTYAIQGPDGSFMEVIAESGSDSVTVNMYGFERLESRSYQVWAIRDDAWVSIGVCNTNAQGEWLGDFDFSLQEGEEVALTIEPRGGSDRPTSEPILRSSY